MVNLPDFIKESDLFRKIEVNELLFVEYKCLVEETKFGIWSDHNYLVYVTTGKKMWRSPLHDYLVNPGQIIFVKKGANLAHQYFDDDFCCLFFFVPDTFIQRFITKNDHLFGEDKGTEDVGDSVIRIKSDERLITYFNSVFHYFSSGYTPDKRLLEIKFEELLFHLTMEDENQTINNYFNTIGKDSAQRLKLIMEANFTYHLKLEDFARLCGMSLSAFKRLFNEIYGETPGRWINEKKIEYSKRLLSKTDKDINQVAFESGFENTSHYIRLFKSKYGSTPHQYRLSAAL